MMDPIKRKEGVLHAIVREVSNLYNANLFSTIYSNYKVIADNNNCQQFNGKFKFGYIDQNNQYCGLPTVTTVSCFAVLLQLYSVLGTST